MLPQLESDPPSLRHHAPGYGQLGLQFLRLPVHTDEDTGSHIANGFRRRVGYQQRVEGLGFRIEAEAEFAAGRNAGCSKGRAGQTQQSQKAFHCPTTSDDWVR